jgi:folate-binding protein YgfZ
MISSSESDFESYRIMCGIPAHPSELSLDFNPMEARLINLISFTKGCYIGQEVIARLDTYKKVQKQLVRFRLGALPNKLPVPCYSEQQEVGIITSAVWEGHVVFALGYLKTTFSENQPLYFMNGTEKITLTVESYNR